ncbi:MAG: maleylpyruvate isomerase N-terminal domain-containing protein [Saprospiraceae bacterium]|nr:maleylpyruvate isomerase N-terminal domain-containing protein [Saprospiraceae bacterium]MDZ4705732.1 maleylpyruvate isomerase N-terminal domain-containing protein [Saprospiraceae bacterium]
MLLPATIPIPTLHLFPVLDQELIALLKSLSPEEWAAPTLARLWGVKDIAAHLLDGNVRTLSMQRDSYASDPPRDIHSYQDLLDYLNGLNASWVAAAKRLSPKVLIELLELTGKQYTEYLSSLDPFAKAPFSVAWAGESESLNWFHIAREYTEKWHHQQQIRDATGRSGLLSQELFHPFIATLMRGMPHAYRNTEATNGTCVKLTVTTDAGGDWYLVRQDGRWTLVDKFYETPAASLAIEPDTAWKLFTKAMTPEMTRKKAEIKGDAKLAAVALGLIAVMA